MTRVAFPLGLTWPDGRPIAAPVPLDEFAELVADAAAALTDQPTAVLPIWTFEEFQPAKPIDRGDPSSAGWSVVVATGDAKADGVIEALDPLIRHRGAAATDVLRYPGGDELDRANWIDEVYLGMKGDRPRYLLLAGDPTHLPFDLQASLASAGASVGRVDFDNNEELSAYVSKVIAHENAPDPPSEAEAIIFATDGGRSDATYYSARYLAHPLAAAIATDSRFTVRSLIGADATKAALSESFARRAGLVFTASHGMMATPADGLSVQFRVNGAWCCQQAPGQAVEDWLLTGEELPASDPIWPGAVVVQFACWGYGTPATSNFDHWMAGVGRTTAEHPFVAAIPKRLLANPRGPIGYVGHVDTAWLHGFDDPAHPDPEGVYHPRLEPMRSLVERALLERTAAGYGLAELVDRADSIASEVSNLTNRLRQKGQTIADLDSTGRAKLADRMIRRNDAMWFLFFGDPGVRIRVGN